MEARIQQLTFTIDGHADSQRNSNMAEQAIVEDSMNALVRTIPILELILKLSKSLTASARGSDEREGVS